MCRQAARLTSTSTTFFPTTSASFHLWPHPFYQRTGQQAKQGKDHDKHTRSAVQQCSRTQRVLSLGSQSANPGSLDRSAATSPCLASAKLSEWENSPLATMTSSRSARLRCVFFSCSSPFTSRAVGPVSRRYSYTACMAFRQQTKKDKEISHGSHKSHKSQSTIAQITQESIHIPVY